MLPIKPSVSRVKSNSKRKKSNFRLNREKLFCLLQPFQHDFLSSVRTIAAFSHRQRLNRSALDFYYEPLSLVCISKNGY